MARCRSPGCAPDADTALILIAMTQSSRSWIRADLPPGTYEALADGLPQSRLWSLLLEVAETRASGRRPAELVEQWDRDRFVQPGIVDQRSLVEVDGHLLAAASAFDAIELSPVAPLGICAIMGHASQNKVLSALRGTELVADPTNVMALECARRLHGNPAAVVRLATSHRCIRAQPIPKQPGFSANFRIFCLASAGVEQQNHAFVVHAIAEHLKVMLHALDRLEQSGFAFPGRRITVLARADRSALADRIVAELEGLPLTRALLEHDYYNHGLRFQVAARSNEGVEIPLIDGGAFDWVARLTSNRRAVYVASGLGSQLVPLMFQRT